MTLTLPLALQINNIFLMDEKLPSLAELTALADKYENHSFLEKDPSQFMHWYLPGDPLYKGSGSVADAETAAFISANLAFGRRDQIIAHIKIILELIDKARKTPVQWLTEGLYRDFFTESDNSFYRMYSYRSMRLFFDVVARILREEGSLGAFFEKKWKKCIEEGKAASGAGLTKDSGILLHHLIAEEFPAECSVVARSKDGAAKKLNMFLRWMVRDNSPVDLGLWKWYDKSLLLMPLDTHVMQEAVKFGFLKKTAAGKVPGANLKTALQLSSKMAEYFAGDPVRGDFALFGLGVDSKN